MTSQTMSNQQCAFLRTTACLINIRNHGDQIDLQRDLCSLDNWAKTLGMLFNSKKCYVMRTSRSKKPIDHYYTLDKEILQQVTNSPHLGVTISDNMNMNISVKSPKRPFHLSVSPTSGFRAPVVSPGGI